MKNNIPVNYTCTSNTVKLFKHLDTLQNLQHGKIVPIMVHTMPTHLCQMNCVYCCFKNRQDKTLEMPLEMYIEGVQQFYKLGTRAIEITGGGEPTLYSYINQAMTIFHNIGMHIGVNSNCIDSQLIEQQVWGYCDWVRASMNVFDYHYNLDLSHIKNSGTSISACYIWNSLSDFNKLREVVKFCTDEKIPCRIAPDCITSLDHIDKSVIEIREMLKSLGDNEYVFLSDFNITTKRPNNLCYTFMIKPCFYTDGNIYACPSAELAIENNNQIQQKTFICKYNEVESFYTNPEAIKPKNIDCSYCKYVKQMDIIHEVLTETSNNEFA